MLSERTLITDWIITYSLTLVKAASVLIFNTEACGWAESVLGDLLRDIKQLPARFHLLLAQSDSVGLCEGDEADNHPSSAFQPLVGFRCFRLLT